MDRRIHLVWIGPEDDAQTTASAVAWSAAALGWDVSVWRSVEGLPPAYQEPLRCARTDQQRANILRWAVLEMRGGLYVDRGFLPRGSPDVLLALTESDRMHAGVTVKGSLYPGILVPGGRFDGWLLVHKALAEQTPEARGGKMAFGSLTLWALGSVAAPLPPEAMAIFYWEPPPNREREPEPPFIAARRAACEACDQATCWFKRLTPCQLWARLKRPGMICPLGCWVAGGDSPRRG